MSPPELMAIAHAVAVLYRRVMGEPPLRPDEVIALVDGVPGSR